MKSIRPNRNKKHYIVSRALKNAELSNNSTHQALKNQAESLNKVSEALKANVKIYSIHPQFK